MSRCKLHLASASSRRYDWLKARLDAEFVDFSAAGLRTEEDLPQSGLDVRTQVQKILASKVEAAKIEMAIQEIGEIEIPDFVLLADTLVEDPDDLQQSLGQPSDRASAAGMLLRLSGRRHNVWSGTSLLIRKGNSWEEKSSVEHATVEINQLTDDQFGDLLDSKSWLGKAGAYDLAGKMGDYASLIHGSEECVLGFAPSIIEELLQLLSS